MIDSRPDPLPSTAIGYRQRRFARPGTAALPSQHAHLEHYYARR